MPCTLLHVNTPRQPELTHMELLEVKQLKLVPKTQGPLLRGCVRLTEQLDVVTSAAVSSLVGSRAVAVLVAAALDEGSVTSRRSTHASSPS